MLTGHSSANKRIDTSAISLDKVIAAFPVSTLLTSLPRERSLNKIGV
jgi:hypothetical protein